MGNIETLRWNRIGTFERYLKAEEEKERAARGNEVDDEDEDAEGELDPDMVWQLCTATEFMLIFKLFESRVRRYRFTKCRRPHLPSLQIRSPRFPLNHRRADVLIMNESGF